MEKPMNVFKLEEYLTKYEFSSQYLLCCSDAESFKMSTIIEMATAEEHKMWDNLSLQYTEPYGHPLLRQKISELYPGLSYENILCFAGAEEGIFCALSCLIQKNDHVITLTPCYQSLLEIPKSKSADVTEIELQEENNWQIDLDLIRKAIKPNTKCIVINFPHNPTGQIIEENQLKSLIELCEHHDIWLFSDEVYRLLGPSKNEGTTPAACLWSKGLSLGVMSKSFGMPGLRIGWIACQNKTMLHQMKLMKDYLSICNSAPSEILSLIALTHREEILKRNNKIVSDNLKILDQFFLEYHHLFEWVRPKGGCVGFVKYKSPESVDSFCDRLLKKKNVLLLPASVYDYHGNHFRIGFGRKNMPECLDRLKEFLND
ncbi:MAG: aminotransferase class I/II-fold pyridoxal phosphate-dependent enzyme [Gammaproteobacteria bacterium]|nr:aminotransferase class I/II-fold pyridoxal phosphate-dependent enzyme [Gammaproteobacteria bacterium]